MRYGQCMEKDSLSLRAHLEEIMEGATENEILNAEERLVELASMIIAYAEEHNIEIDTTLTDKPSDGSVTT